MRITPDYSHKGFLNLEHTNVETVAFVIRCLTFGMLLRRGAFSFL
jgi:hypothetical protein